MLRVACDLARQAVFFAVMADGVGSFVGIWIDQPEVGTLRREAFVQRDDGWRVAVGDRAIGLYEE